MKTLVTMLFGACMALAVGGAAAQEAKKDDPAKQPTLQECKDHVAMAKKDAVKDDATMKKDAACTDVIKKDAAMKSDSKAADPAKK